MEPKGHKFKLCNSQDVMRQSSEDLITDWIYIPSIVKKQTNLNQGNKESSFSTSIYN